MNYEKSLLNSHSYKILENIQTRKGIEEDYDEDILESRIYNLEEDINDEKKNLKKCNKNIELQFLSINENENTLDNYTNKLKKLNNDLLEKRDLLKKFGLEENKLSGNIENYDTKIDTINSSYNSLLKNLNNLNNKIKEDEEKIQNYKQLFETNKKLIEKLEKENQKKILIERKKKEELRKKKRYITNLNANLEKINIEIKKSSELEQKNKLMLNDITSKINITQKEFDEKKNVYTTIQEKVLKKEKEIENIRKIEADKKRRLNELYRKKIEIENQIKTKKSIYESQLSTLKKFNKEKIEYEISIDSNLKLKEKTNDSIKKITLENNSITKNTESKNLDLELLNKRLIELKTINEEQIKKISMSSNHYEVLNKELEKLKSVNNELIKKNNLQGFDENNFYTQSLNSNNINIVLKTNKNKNSNFVLQKFDDKNLNKKEFVDKIYIFSQFFIPKNFNRYTEIKCCLKNNLKNPHINYVVLLNERIYSESELGITNLDVNIKSKIIQIEIYDRLTYKNFFEHIKFMDMEGYCVLHNADIIFDLSIKNIFKTSMFNKRSFYCLNRHDNKYYNFKNKETSQDVWIFHSNHEIKNLNLFDINLGYPGCDNKMAFLLKMKENFNLFNYPNYIRSLHIHKNNLKSWNKYEKIPGPYLYIKPKL